MLRFGTRICYSIEVKLPGKTQDDNWKIKKVTFLFAEIIKKYHKQSEYNKPAMVNDRPLPLTGLLAFCLLILQPYLSLTHLDSLQQWSLIAFAIAIPGLSTSIAIISIHRIKLITKRSQVLYGVINYSSIFTALIGIILTFFHFSTAIGWWFLISCLICFIINTFLINTDESNLKQHG